MSSPPSTLGQYQIIREIARSNDIVYEAYDPLMNRRVAVKELSMPSGSAGPQREDRINRFKREAQAAGTLNHPNIMTVYSFAEDAGRTFMAMEYLDGQTLRNELDTRGALPTDRAVEIAIAVLSGLEHAHSKGVIHRDIKPDNIQILSNGTIKITDFGIARLTFQPNLTMDGQVFGTPSYMSPEQVVGREIDARSDLFSVGVMLYEMLAGQKPFPGDSVVTITYAIMNKEPDQPQQIPWALWQVIHRALEKSPAMRYASAAEMKSALEAALRPETPSGMPVIDPFASSTQNPYAPPNPYGQPYPPQPPPAPYNPYAPQQTINSPYVPPGPNSNPYAGQYGQPTPPPVSVPVTFPYNPFQAGGGGMAPHTPGMMPPGSAPVYYPPPPRAPLFKPETVNFAKRLVITIMIVGALFGLIIVCTGALTDAVARAGQERDRVEAVKQANQVLQDSSKTTEDKIAYWQKLRDGMAAGADTSNEDHTLGALYFQRAKDELNQQPPQALLAERDLKTAVEYDPHNPDVLRGQGDLYASSASGASTGNDQALLYEQSANAYKAAADQDTDPTLKDQDSMKFGQAAKLAGDNALQTSDTSLVHDIRNLLETAQPYVQNHRDVASQIEDVLNAIRSRG